MNQNGTIPAWLVRKSGRLNGRRQLIRGDAISVGRSPDNDVIVDDAATVSARHFEIRQENGAYRIYDLNSMNGTFVDGERITDAELAPSSSIRLGASGPEFTFVLGVEPPQDLNETREASPAEKAPAVRIHSAHEEALSEAVSRARAARGTGVGDQTLDIMRDMLYAALRRARRKLKITIAVLLAALAAGSAFAYWKIETLRVEKDRIDAAIANLEKVIETAALSGRDVGSLADRIDEYESQGRALQSTMLYRMGVDHAADPVERQIRELLAEFGSETYRVPTEFRDQVTRFIVRYQGPDRPHIIAALGRSKREIQTMRRILEDAHIPPDLAYMAVVESALGSGGKSGAGAAGIWQFTPVTARNYGLTVNGAVDERLDVRKSTRAAAKMLRELILDFGAGSSVMLALAAYNSGPARVRQEIRKVADPIKQRNFWHLYRVHALPAETREYVPKVIAAMIIGRDPGQFGFES